MKNGASATRQSLSQVNKHFKAPRETQQMPPPISPRGEHRRMLHSLTHSLGRVQTNSPLRCCNTLGKRLHRRVRTGRKDPLGFSCGAVRASATSPPGPDPTRGTERHGPALPVGHGTARHSSARLGSARPAPSAAARGAEPGSGRSLPSLPPAHGETSVPSPAPSPFPAPPHLLPTSRSSGGDGGAAPHAAGAARRGWPGSGRGPRAAQPLTARPGPAHLSQPGPAHPRPRKVRSLPLLSPAPVGSSRSFGARSCRGGRAASLGSSGRFLPAAKALCL